MNLGTWTSAYSGDVMPLYIIIQVYKWWNETKQYLLGWGPSPL